MKKILAIATFIAGYVLGSKAGKERYTQIKKYSNKIYKTPIVEKTVKKVSDKAETFVKKQGEKVTDKIAEVVKNNLFSVKISDMDSATKKQETHNNKNTNTTDYIPPKNNYSTIDTDNLPE